MGSGLSEALQHQFEIVRAVHTSLPAIRAVADHLTPVEDLVEFQNEIGALYAKLGLLVAASETIIQATEAGTALLLAPDALHQRALLQLETAALRPQEYFATAEAFASLVQAVADMGLVVDQLVLDMVQRITREEFEQVIAALQARIVELEELLNGDGGSGGGDGSITENIQVIIDQLEVIETDMLAFAQLTTELHAQLQSLDGTVTGNADAIEQLTVRVQNTENGMEAFSQQLTQLASQIVDLAQGIAGNAGAIQTLTTQVVTQGNEIFSLAQAQTQLGAQVLDLETGQAAQAEAIQTLSTEVSQTQEGLSILSSDVTSLRSEITSVGNHLPNAGFEADLRDWFFVTRGAGWLSSDLQRDMNSELTPPSMHTLGITAAGTPSGIAAVETSRVGVGGASHFMLSAWLAAENCEVSLEYRIFNVAGSIVVADTIGAVVTTGPVTNLAEWPRTFGLIPVPLDGVEILVRLTVRNAHTGSPRAWLLRPMLENALATTLEPSPWVLGMTGSDVALATAVSSLSTSIEQTNDALSIVAADLTDLAASIVSMEGNDNLINQATFEEGDSGSWTNATVVATGTLNGFTKGLQLYGVAVEEDNWFLATEGEEFEFSAWVLSNDREGNGITQLRFELSNAVNASLGILNAAGATHAHGLPAWTFITGRLAIPAGVTKARPSITFSGIGPGPIRVNNLRITRLNQLSLANAQATQELSVRVTETEDSLEAISTDITELVAELVQEGFQAGFAWSFIETVAGFTGVGVGRAFFDALSNYGAMAVTTTAIDGYLLSPVISLHTKVNPIVRALVRRRNAGDWRGRLMWKNNAHDFSGSHYFDTPDTPEIAAWEIVEWDLSANADWREDNVDLNQLRFYFSNTPGNIVDVRWIAIGDRGTLNMSARASERLEAKVVAVEGSVTATAESVTTLRSELGGNMLPGKNLLMNPSGGSGTAGWVLTAGTSSYLTAETISDVPNIRCVSGASSANRNVYQDYTNPAVAGEPFVFSADVWVSGSTQGDFAIDIVGLDMNGVPVWIPSSMTLVTARNTWSRVSYTETPTADVITIRVRLRCINGTFSTWRFRRAKLEIGSVATAYSDDAIYSAAMMTMSTSAQQLATGQTMLLARAAMTLDVNGYVTGWEVNNNGTTGDFIIHANNFRIVTPGNTPQTPFALTGNNLYINADLHMGSGKNIINRRGSYMSVTGNGFGSSNQFLEWFGPNLTNLTQCTETNAVWYIKTNGDAYFGGSLTAGTLRNANQTSVITFPGAAVTVGPFATNGDPRTVTLSFSRRYEREAITLAGTYSIGSGSNTGVVRLYRKIGTAAETLWQTLNISGSSEVFNEPDILSRAVLSWGGSATYNDTSPAASTVQYRAELISGTTQVVNFSGGGGEKAPIITQRLSVISIEE